ncbi:MAG: electron transfer flavoprotein subunit beta/FixA family protein [Oscillospiraceae bacterium]|jgi:electron transfer flavoprotein beta subunit|nr:electron transfer flavoprotein subunit beta/FixA family protein [Oscillospiraceae bacterium]
MGSKVLNIIVCIKQVPNIREARLDPGTGTMLRDAIPSIMNPDDKAALEAALRLKDSRGAHVTVLSMGPPQAETALREALAMGADEAFLLTDRAFAGSDTCATAYTIAAAIKVMKYDLIFTGRQAIDGDTAQVGPQIAEHLQIANISYAEKITVQADAVIVTSRLDNCSYVVKAKMPCLITTLSELNEPRYMTPGGVFEAYREEIKKITRRNLDADSKRLGQKGSPTHIAQTCAKSAKTTGIVADHLNSQEAAEYLLEKLREQLIIS